MEPGAPDERQDERRRMVDRQLRGRDIADAHVLQAMLDVPRHRFVPAALQRQAYDDTPLQIGFQQTISQPYVVAFMTQALRLDPEHEVLEIGTGSGYQAAVLSRLTRHVCSLEMVEPLAEGARRVLAELGYRNVDVRVGNGYAGWPERAPFDRIMVTAAPEVVPQALVDQLVAGGIMAIPVGRDEQVLRILRKTGDRLETLERLPVRFVPMIGAGPEPPG